MKEAPVRSLGLRAANVRRIVVTVATALVLASGRPGQGADGGIRAREEGPPGASLGPLPFAAGGGKAGDADPEKRYALTPGANGVLLYEAPQFSAVVAPDGAVTFHNRRLAYSARTSTFRFDLSDESRSHAKADFLAATLKRRTAMAAAANGAHDHGEPHVATSKASPYPAPSWIVIEERPHSGRAPRQLVMLKPTLAARCPGVLQLQRTADGRTVVGPVKCRLLAGTDGDTEVCQLVDPTKVPPFREGDQFVCSSAL
jgi:hypothetical protein